MHTHIPCVAAAGVEVGGGVAATVVVAGEVPVLTFLKISNSEFGPQGTKDWSISSYTKQKDPWSRSQSWPHRHIHTSKRGETADTPKLPVLKARFPWAAA